MSTNDPAPPADRAVRAITDDGSFRVITLRTTDTVRGAAAAQGVRGDVVKPFGELVTGAVLIREAMAPKLRVQAILKGAGGLGSLVADAHPDGTSRGLVNFGKARENAGGALSMGPGALLQVMRTLPSGSLHQGIVEVPEGAGVSGALMAYMQESEQVVSMIGVTTIVDGDTIAVSGGDIVQLLPEAARGPLMLMTERLAHDFARLDDVLRAQDGSPDALLDELLYGMPYTRIESSPLSFGCHCSQLRVVSTLATLPRSDIEDLLRDGKVLEIRCDYCGREYQVHPAQLRSLLTTS